MPQRQGPDHPFRPERHAAPVPARLRPGMTLIELMIVLLVSIIILGAAFSLYQVNARYYVAQDALLEQQQNLRAALYSIARDVRYGQRCCSAAGLPSMKSPASAPPRLSTIWTPTSTTS